MVASKRLVAVFLVAALASGAFGYFVGASDQNVNLGPLFQSASAEKPNSQIPLIKPATAPFKPFLTRPAPSPSGVREYTLMAEDMDHEVFPGVMMPGWTVNGTVPGPTIVAIEGELVRIKFVNTASRPHTIHFHGVHEIQSDGVHEIVFPGESYVYELEAEPAGLYLYHSHVLPITKHVNQGFFGAYIVYPKEPLPPAKEIVLIMQFVDTDGDSGEAEFYAFNGRADQFINNPIEFKVGEPVRIYLINMNIEIATLHTHGTFFTLYRSPLKWTTTSPQFTDVVGLAWGERAIIELSYKYQGLWMFHDHIGEHSEEGLRGWFEVVAER